MKIKPNKSHPLKERKRFLLLGIVLLILLGPTTSTADLPELPSTGVLMDCGSLWIDGASTRVRFQASRGLYREGGQRARLEWAPGSLFSTESPPPQVALFQCVPGEKTGKVIPFTSESYLDASGTLFTEFDLPDEAAPFQEFRFHLYINSKRDWTQVPVLSTRSYQGNNRLINGTLDQFSDLEPDTPSGWYVQGTRSTGGFSVSSERIDIGDGGGVRLKVVGPDSSASPPPSPKVSQAENFPVVAGQRLELSSRSWIRSATGVGLRVEVRFQGEDGGWIVPSLILESDPGVVTTDHEVFRTWGEVPSGAVSATVRLAMRANIGVTDIDWVQIRPAG